MLLCCYVGMLVCWYVFISIVLQNQAELSKKLCRKLTMISICVKISEMFGDLDGLGHSKKIATYVVMFLYNIYYYIYV